MRSIILSLLVAVASFTAFSTQAQSPSSSRIVVVDLQTDQSTESTNNLDLVEGEFAELIWYAKPNNIGVSINHEGTNGVSMLAYGLLTTPDYLTKPLGAGPGKVQFRYFATSSGTMRYARCVVKITKFETPVASPTGSIPSTAVVIPSDATGPVNVILESSADLVTWTPALPGSYGSTEPKRFFRVRAVKE